MILFYNRLFGEQGCYLTLFLIRSLQLVGVKFDLLVHQFALTIMFWTPGSCVIRTRTGGLQRAIWRRRRARPQTHHTKTASLSLWGIGAVRG